MNTTISIRNYLNEIASSAPTPGGGNVSAFAGSLAAALGMMVCQLSYGKKKYLPVEPDLKACAERLEVHLQSFISLAHQDNLAFDMVMDAFRLPKDSDEEKATRLERISSATLHAASVPYTVMETCLACADDLIFILEKGNANSQSDSAVALLQVVTSAKGAYYNVLINCSSLKGNTKASDLSLRAEQILQNLEAKILPKLQLFEQWMKQ